ncbi:hypothetical protein ZWY2020_027942 [Hordeum vulgare]|nr:hypothetical protein ZWY2020_027942 [Hordeum vulgare]
MVKGRTGQRVRLYVRGSILGFKRYMQWKRSRRRRGVQYYSSASISIARTDILNVSRRRLPTLPMLRSSRSGTLRVHGLEEKQQGRGSGGLKSLER